MQSLLTDHSILRGTDSAVTDIRFVSRNSLIHAHLIFGDGKFQVAASRLYTSSTAHQQYICLLVGFTLIKKKEKNAETDACARTHTSVAEEQALNSSRLKRKKSSLFVNFTLFIRKFIIFIVALGKNSNF